MKNYHQTGKLHTTLIAVGFVENDSSLVSLQSKVETIIYVYYLFVYLVTHLSSYLEKAIKAL